MNRRRPDDRGTLPTVASPAMLKRDTTEAGHHLGRSHCRGLGMRKAVVCLANQGRYSGSWEPSSCRHRTPHGVGVGRAGLASWPSPVFLIGEPHGQALA